MTYREAALQLLKERGPMHYQDLADAMVAAGLVQTDASTPAASLNAMIAVDIKRKGKQSPFVRIKPGVFGLRDKHQDEVLASVDGDAAPLPDGDDAADQRVRVPLFPVYTELRHLLRVWPGRPRKQITGLRSTIGDLRGTPQKTVDWTEPATRIPERLEGDDRELAEAIWAASNGTVNPVGAKNYYPEKLNKFNVLTPDEPTYLVRGPTLPFLSSF